MWYLITIHKEPQFYADDPDNPITVVGLPYTNTLFRGNEYIKFEPAIIEDSEKAISILEEHGVKGFKRKLDAKAHAKTIGLTKGFKYLNTKQNPPEPGYL